MSAFRFEFGDVDDSGDTQRVRGYGTAGEELTKVHRIQSHGLYSNPPKGAHGVAIPLGGERDLSVVIGGEVPGSRPRNIPPGQTVLYDADGNIIRMFGSDGIKLNAGGRPVEVTASGLKLSPGGGGPAKLQVGSLTIEVTGTLRIESGDVKIGPIGASFLPVQTTGGASSVLSAAV